MSQTKWSDADGPIAEHIEGETRQRLDAYRSAPRDVAEHHAHEREVQRGGYSRRQLIELIQNAADQIAGAEDHRSSGRIEVRLTADCLYCADDGETLSQAGVTALMHARLGTKRGGPHIGRFGIGFKSILRFTDRPAILSRTGSIQWDAAHAAQQIRSVVPDATDCPVLRTAFPANAIDEMHRDPILADLMQWAQNIVRLPLVDRPNDDPSAVQLSHQLHDFEPEFLLFVPHVRELVLVDEHGVRRRTREFNDASNGHVLELRGADGVSSWRVFRRQHKLSDAARADSRAPEGVREMLITWAAPLDRRSTEMRFWSYFPTSAPSLVGGILNAPWETDDSRATVLPNNRCNEELIRAAAVLVIQSLPQLSEPGNPAGHLDLLPRQRAAGDRTTAGDMLRRQIFAGLLREGVVPNQDGVLCRIGSLLVPPKEVTPGQRVLLEPLAAWSQYAHRPANWIHNDALGSARLSAIARIVDRGTSQHGYLPRQSLQQWLQALIDSGLANSDAVGASRAAILTAAAFDDDSLNFGDIVLAEDGSWQPLERDEVFLPGDGSEPSTTVHRELVDDPNVSAVLEQFQIQPPTPESALQKLAEELLEGAVVGIDIDAKWMQFWNAVSAVPPNTALETIQQHPKWSQWLCVRTEDDAWHPVSEVLLPGPIVSDADPQILSFVVDRDFHQPHLSVLDRAGVSEGPKQIDPSPHTPPCLSDYVERCFSAYQTMGHMSRPHRARLRIYITRHVEPLEVLPKLPPHARARFTNALLSLDATYDTWHIRHETVQTYEPMNIHTFAFEAVRRFGLVESSDGYRPITDGLGERPKSREVQQWLLRHPKTVRIRRAFGDELQRGHDGHVEPVGDDEPVPLLDFWPGLRSFLDNAQLLLNLVRCDDLLDDQAAPIHWDVAADGDVIYLRRQLEERAELELLCDLLGLDLSAQTLERILSHATDQDVARARALIRRQPTEAEKLLKAVGEQNLRNRLPNELLAVLDHAERPFEGIAVAEAAIASYHTGALKAYREHLDHLNAPGQFDGRRAALRFVRELEFGDEWAGTANPKRRPYEEVDGPQSFPDLHDYQRKAADSIIAALGADAPLENRRGILSMPTGSGKTRVAVKAIIEAIERGFQGDILWVADRDELCEQAVEDWQRSWRAVGVASRQLRVSRVWGGQNNPEPIANATNVIVASIQTLYARTDGKLPDYLGGVRLLVIDEAHASIAPIYTELLGPVHSIWS